MKAKGLRNLHFFHRGLRYSWLVVIERESAIFDAMSIFDIRYSTFDIRYPTCRKLSFLPFIGSSNSFGGARGRNSKRARSIPYTSWLVLAERLELRISAANDCMSLEISTSTSQIWYHGDGHEQRERDDATSFIF